MYVPGTTFLLLLICLNENEKRLWCLILYVINTVRKIAPARVSLLMISSTLLFAELLDLRRPVPEGSHSLVELAKSELPRLQVRNVHTWY